MNKENWDDIRFVLAVVDTGSVSGAARVLGVNHATVLRRVASFEERNGGPIFDRSATGYQIAQDKLRAIEAAKEVANAVESVERLLKGSAPKVSGVVRITSTDSLCLEVLPEIVARMMQDLPDLRIELHSTNAHLDLARLHADISIRPARVLPDDLIGESAGQLRFAVYHPVGLPDASWLGLRGPLLRSVVADWVQDQMDGNTAVAGADSFPVLAQMVAQSIGRAVLPSFIGDVTAGIVRADLTLPVADVPVWVATHGDLAETPRLRLVRRVLANALRDRLA